jgi:sugar transferase EpsL
VFDLVASALALTVLSPAIAAVAVVVWTRLGSPVLFRQLRPGLHGHPFVLIKFRSMNDAAGPDGRPLPDAKRLTALGRRLREWSLDELPTLWNVLRGEMSLIGPRPLLMEYLDRYTPRQARRHEVKPGITGWAQVNGRNALSWEAKFELDVWYVEHWSLWLDTTILAMTIWQVLTRQGIVYPGSATMPEFLGQSPSDGRRDTSV